MRIYNYDDLPSVLISIKPKWCELIACLKKTIELRKTAPKISTPFKVYIYCTNEKTLGDFIFCKSDENAKLFGYNTAKGINKGFVKENDVQLKGKVIGEFVCDAIIRHCEMANADIAEQQGYIRREKLLEYANGKELLGWHISNLVIYSIPKELNEFYVPCKKYDLDKREVPKAHCTDCGNENGIAPCEYINQKWCIPVKRPPQSWMYVILPKINFKDRLKANY